MHDYFATLVELVRKERKKAHYVRPESLNHKLQAAAMAHIRQSKPDSGLGLQVKVLEILKNRLIQVDFFLI